MRSLAFLLLLLLAAPATAQAEPLPRTKPVHPQEQVTPTAQSLWRLDIRRHEPAKDFPGPRVVSDEARVFYLQQGQVKAVDAKTGRQLWAFQTGKGAQLKYTSGWLFAIAQSGTVVALEPETGRVRWSRKAIADFTVAEQTLYVANPGGVRAFDLSTGKLLWHTKERFLQPSSSFYNGAPLTVIGNRIFVQSVSSGAITTTNTYIYSSRTGKRLSEAYSYGPLAAVADKVYFVVHNFPTQLDYPDRFEINVYSLQTGRLLEEHVYNV